MYGIVPALEAIGYVEGRDYTLLWLPHGGDRSRLPALAVELVALQPDVITAAQLPATTALASATATVPVLGYFNEDMANELVGEQWGRPKANFSGIVDGLNGEAGKQLQVLVGAVPAARRIGVLGDSTRVEAIRQELVDAAEALDRDLVFAPFFGAEERLAALETLTREGVGAVLATGGIDEGQGAPEVRAWAEVERVPVMWSSPSRVENGSLMSYGQNTYLSRASNADLKAEYIVKIIYEGATPADLPLLVLPTVFAINLKAAKAIGFTFPVHILALAEVVFE